MPIFINGNQYEDEAHLEAAYSPMLKNMGVDVKPLPPKTGDDVDPKMVVTPNEMQTNKELEAQDDAVLGGTEISNRIYVGKTPLQASTEPAGEFKLRGGNEIPTEPNSSPEPSKALTEAYLEKLSGTKNPRPAGDIVMDVLKNLNDKIMNAIKLPGDAWQGNVDPMSEEGSQRAVDLASLIVLGGVGRTLDAASVAGKPAFRPNPSTGEVAKPVEQYISELEKQWKQQPLDYDSAVLKSQINSAEGLTPWQAADKFHELYSTKGPKEAIQFAHRYEDKASDAHFAEYEKFVNDENYYKHSKAFGGSGEAPASVTVKTMTPEEVQAMQKSWGKSDVDIHPQTKAMIDHFIKQPLMQKAETLPEKMSPKEAFQQAVEDAASAFASTVGNIKNKFIEAAREPLHQVPNIEKARAKGYDIPAFKGMVTQETGPNPVFDFKKSYSEIYSTESSLLAEMYAGWTGNTKAPRAAGKIEEGEFTQGAQVVPLLINAKDYLVYDAAGKSWQFVNQKAIDEARKLGKPGVIMQNVWDEPGSTTYLGSPKTVYITLPKGASTVKSRFAKNFDPTSPDMLNSIGAIGIGGTAGYLSMKVDDVEPIDPNLPHK